MNKTYEFTLNFTLPVEYTNVTTRIWSPRKLKRFHERIVYPFASTYITGTVLQSVDKTITIHLNRVIDSTSPPLKRRNKSKTLLHYITNIWKSIEEENQTKQIGKIHSKNIYKIGKRRKVCYINVRIWYFNNNHI